MSVVDSIMNYPKLISSVQSFHSFKFTQKLAVNSSPPLFCSTNNRLLSSKSEKEERKGTFFSCTYRLTYVSPSHFDIFHPNFHLPKFFCNKQFTTFGFNFLVKAPRIKSSIKHSTRWYIHRVVTIHPVKSNT